MLYSIGYQGLDSPRVIAPILQKLGVSLLLDVRSKPYSSNGMWNLPMVTRIMNQHGIEYKWAGQRLGGFAEISESDILYLAEQQKARTICLMCMEHYPKDCHRHYEIAKRLYSYGINVEHVLVKNGEPTYVMASDVIDKEKAKEDTGQLRLF